MNASTRREIWVFKLFTALFWFSNYIISPYISPYMSSLGANNIMIGYVVSSYSIAQILARVPLGILSDKLGKRKKFIVLGALLTLVSVTGLWLTNSPGMVFAFRCLQGLAVTSWVCATVLYATYMRPEESVNATLQLQVCNSGGTLVGYFIGGAVAARYGYNSVFFVAMIGAALALAVSLAIAERPAPQRQIHVPELLKVGFSPFLLLVSGLSVFGQIILSATTWGFNPQIATNLGADAGGIAIVSICYSVAGLLTALFVSKRAVRWQGEKRTLIIAATLEAVFCILTARSPSLTALYVCSFLSGVAHNMCYSLLLGLSIQCFPERMRAVAMGYHQSIYALGLLIGPIIAGYVSEQFSLESAYLTLGIIGLLSPVITACLFDRAKRGTINQLKNHAK